MVGSEMRTMFVSIAAIRVAMVVFERTFHLYCIARPAAGRARQPGGDGGGKFGAAFAPREITVRTDEVTRGRWGPSGIPRSPSKACRRTAGTSRARPAT